MTGNHQKPFQSEEAGAFLRCAARGDVAGMEALVAEGLDLTRPDTCGESIISQMMLDLEDEKPEHRLAMIKEAVRLGADPRQLDVDRYPPHDVFGPLVGAMLRMDTPLIRFLLDHGADPNALIECGRPRSLLDWAWTDYMLHVWDWNKVPEGEQETEEEQATEEGSIAFFDRIAVKYGKRRPDFIALLRERGALTGEELREREAASGSAS